jgi:hypothetical protein
MNESLRLKEQDLKLKNLQWHKFLNL